MAHRVVSLRVHVRFASRADERMASRLTQCRHWIGQLTAPPSGHCFRRGSAILSSYGQAIALNLTLPSAERGLALCVTKARRRRCRGDGSRAR
jgi:hypothetical protein